MRHSILAAFGAVLLTGCGGHVDDGPRSSAKQELEPRGETELVVDGVRTGVHYALNSPPEPVLPTLTLRAEPVDHLERSVELTGIGDRSVRFSGRDLTLFDSEGRLAKVTVAEPDPVRLEAEARGSYARLSLGATALAVGAIGDSSALVSAAERAGYIDFAITGSNLRLSGTANLTDGRLSFRVEPGAPAKSARAEGETAVDAPAEEGTPLIVGERDTGIRYSLGVPPDPVEPPLLALTTVPVRELHREWLFGGIAVHDPALGTSPLTVRVDGGQLSVPREGVPYAFQTTGDRDVIAEVHGTDRRSIDALIGSTRRLPIVRVTQSPPDPVDETAPIPCIRPWKLAFQILGSNSGITGAIDLETGSVTYERR